MLENRNHGHFSPRGRPFPAPDRGEIQTKMAQEICSEWMWGAEISCSFFKFFLYFFISPPRNANKFLWIRKLLIPYIYILFFVLGRELKFRKLISILIFLNIFDRFVLYLYYIIFELYLIDSFVSEFIELKLKLSRIFWTGGENWIENDGSSGL